MSISGKYAIVGVGYTSQGKLPKRTALSFCVEASINAINDAGLKKEDIDGIISYRHFKPLDGEDEITSYLIAQSIGIKPKFVSQEGDCARPQLMQAISALEAGFCNYILVVFGDNAFSGRRQYGEVRYIEPIYGYFGASAGYAMAAMRAIHEFGTGPETWQEIVVSQRKWAALNPKAILKDKPLSYEKYMKSELIFDPFRKHDCCLINDGGRAYILTSIERARDLPNPPVLILGIGHHSPAYYLEFSDYMTGNTGAKIAGEDAFRMAGVRKEDVDAAEVYDCFSYVVEITLQDYGYFKPGEGKDWFKEVGIGPGGNFPINTSGGLLAEAYLMGTTPLTEGVMQLMGRCGDHQLGQKTGTKSPKIILVSDNGGVLQSHTCIILGKD